MNTNPAEQLTLWAEQLRALAAHGQHYADNVYDRDRYQTIIEIALALLALASGETLADLEPLRATVLAHVTPFAVGDAAIIDDEGRMLLIRRADNGLWAMPGGGLEVGETVAAGIVREALEEAGVYSEAVGIVGIFDSRFCGTKSRHHLYQITMLCRPLDQPPLAEPSHAHEVLETAWFAEADLPATLDPGHRTRIPIAFQVYRGERPPSLIALEAGLSPSAEPVKATGESRPFTTRLDSGELWIYSSRIQSSVVRRHRVPMEKRQSPEH